MMLVKLDRDSLVEELYRLRSMLDVTQDDAKRQLASIIDLVSKAPSAESQSNYPRMGHSR